MIVTQVLSPVVICETNKCKLFTKCFKQLHLKFVFHIFKFIAHIQEQYENTAKSSITAAINGYCTGIRFEMKNKKEKALPEEQPISEYKKAAKDHEDEDEELYYIVIFNSFMKLFITFRFDQTVLSLVICCY